MHTNAYSNGTVSLTFTETQTQKNELMRVQTVHVINHNGNSDNLPCYPPDSYQCDRAVYWRKGMLNLYSIYLAAQTFAAFELVSCS